MSTNTLTPRLPRPRRYSPGDYRTRKDAVRDAREALWGSPLVRQCGFLPLDTGSLGEGYVPGTYVTANVNGRLVLIGFDNFGRAEVEQID